MTVNKNRPTGRQSRWGICTNPNCPNYRQKIEIERGELICPEESCKKPLSPCAPPKTDPDPKWKKIAIIAAAVVVLAGAGFGIYSLISGGQEISKIKLEPKSLTMVIGQKDVVKATVEDKDGNEIKDAKVTYKWTVGDEKIASVTQGGEVAALKKGKTSITVKIEGDDEHRATCQIEVKDGEKPNNGGKGGSEEVLITSLSVDNTSISLKEGEQAELSVRVEPANFTEGISAESNHPEVAVVENSVITAKKAGTAQIVIRTEKSGKSASIVVTVTKKSTGGTGEGGKSSPTKGRYHGTISMGNYGTYSGDILNGKPDGAGVLTYSRHYQAGRDFKTGEAVHAEKGERVDGTWNNGYLSSGVIYKKDGNTIKIKH